MTYVVFALWILMWGAAGYFTVRVIRACIEWRRDQKAMAAWYAEHMKQKKSTNTSTDNQVVYNPFVGIL